MIPSCCSITWGRFKSDRAGRPDFLILPIAASQFTYLLNGQMEHQDSFGNRGLLEAGDVQWMTPGSGLVHSQMPGRELVRKGGPLEGFQLWVNLPRRDKMTPPCYQELKLSAIPSTIRAAGGVRVRAIAGESLETARCHRKPHAQPLPA